MQLVAAGDRSAQTQVAQRLMPKAEILSRLLLGKHADTFDAVQAGMEAVLKSARHFRGESSLETWAQRVFVRTTLRGARKRLFWRRVLPWSDEVLAPAENAPSPQHGLARPLAAYMDALPESRREVLVLRYALELSVSEIAEELGVGRDTVKYRLKQALSEVRALIRRDLALNLPKSRL